MSKFQCTVEFFSLFVRRKLNELEVNRISYVSFDLLFVLINPTLQL